MKLVKTPLREVKIPLKRVIRLYLRDGDSLCHKCGGVGILFEDAPLNTDTSKSLTRTTHMPCPHCNNGVIHSCPHCRESLRKGQIHCNCAESKKSQRVQREKVRQSAHRQATYVSYSEACEQFTFFYIHEYDEFVHVDEFEDWVRVMRENDDDFSLLSTNVYGTKKEDILQDVDLLIAQALQTAPMPPNAFHPDERKALLNQLIASLDTQLTSHRYRYIPDYLTVIKVQQESFTYTDS